MRQRYFFVTIILGTVFALIPVLLASCSFPPNTAIQMDSPSDVREAKVEHVVVQVDAGALVSATTEPVASQATPMQDGLALLTAHCTRCHVTAWFDQIERPRAEWEKAIARMEGMGVYLTDTEKDVLLNYLAVTDKP